MSVYNNTISYIHPDLTPASLTEENVIFYFCDSANPFYERSCDNETLRMQNRPMSNLEQMNGMQYVLESAAPPLFVIRKHKRNSPTEYTPTNYYYIINGVINECPSAYTCVQTRLANCTSSLTQAMMSTLSMLRVSAVDGWKWQFETQPVRPRAEMNDDESRTSTDMNDPFANTHLSHNRLSDSDPLRVRATLFQRLHTQRALQMLMERFPPKTVIVPPTTTTADETSALKEAAKQT